MATSLPISSLEFVAMLRRARPPSGWSETLAVANSGGPDSICLLFLLNRYVREIRQESDDVPFTISPKRVVSLSIDHDLQTSSIAMAKHAASVAESLEVKHITTKLSWGQGTHPPKPGPHEKIEERARDMRQMVLFRHMKRLGANALASGHHADDQVETMFMRLGRGSSQLGLSGMRSCRRWGMGTGDEGHDKLYGIEGMRKWMVRPLLEVSKDRILATCEDNKLEYVTDPTNFQPQLTIRNTIRHILKNGGSSGLCSQDPSFVDLPPALAQQAANINIAASGKSMHGFHLASNISDLRKINNVMLSTLRNVDETVDHVIAEHRLPSPPGTFLISPRSLKAIGSPLVQEALLFRITRYISPEPWGSPRSELGRRKTSMSRLLSHLCNVDSFDTRKNNSLCVGSGVWWRPVVVLDNRLRTTFSDLNEQNLAWLALRQPPQRTSANQGRSDRVSLHSDISYAIMERRNAWLLHQTSCTLEILFDRRFFISIRVDQLPQEILESLSTGSRILIESTKPWTLPRVVHMNDEVPTTIHTHISSQPLFQYRELGGSKMNQDIESNWITVEYFRPLSSI